MAEYSTQPVMPEGTTYQNLMALWMQQNYPNGVPQQQPAGPDPMHQGPWGGGAPMPNYSSHPSPYTPGMATGWQLPAWMQGGDVASWRGRNLSEALANYGQALPWYQLQQNAQQYDNDFGEARRRWDQQFANQYRNDMFNQGLAREQQDMAKWVAEQQQGNWGKQFGFDQEMGRGQLDLGNREAGNRDWYNRAQIGEAAARRTQDADLAREGYTNQKDIATMNAFGRTKMPNARFVRSW